MLPASEALFVVKLRAGEKLIPFHKIPLMVAEARIKAERPDFDPETDDGLEAELYAINYREKLQRAVELGEISPLNPSTWDPLDLPIGDLLERSVIAVQDLRRFIEGLRGAVETVPPPTVPSAESKSRIDWISWTSVKRAEDWVACALSLNIDPKSLRHHAQAWMAGPDAPPVFAAGSFPSQELEDKFDKRLRLLRANRYDRTVFTLPMAKHSNLGPNEVLLTEFAAWGLSIGWSDMPPELAALASQRPLPASQVSAAITAGEWDALVESEEAAREDRQYVARYDRAAQLYLERDRLLQHFRGDPSNKDEEILNRLTRNRNEISELEAGVDAFADLVSITAPRRHEETEVGAAENKWDEYKLRRLWDESKEVGMTHQKLAEKYKVTRQRIGTLLKRAKESFGPKKADPFGQLKANRRK